MNDDLSPDPSPQGEGCSSPGVRGEVLNCGVKLK